MRPVPLLLLLLIVIVIGGAVWLMFADVPVTQTRVEVAVPNEQLGIR